MDLAHTRSIFLYNVYNYNELLELLPMEWGGGGAVAQSVERASPGEEVPGSIPAVVTRSVLVGSAAV